MSKTGAKLSFDGDGVAKCPDTGEVYRKVSSCKVIAAADEEAVK